MQTSGDASPKEATLTVEVPIACSLSEVDLPQRLADARALGADALVGVEARDREARLHFRGERGRVDRLVAAETQCCSFLEFSMHHAEEHVELEIRTPEGGEPVLRSLVAAIVAGWEGGL